MHLYFIYWSWVGFFQCMSIDESSEEGVRQPLTGGSEAVGIREISSLDFLPPQACMCLLRVGKAPIPSCAVRWYGIEHFTIIYRSRCECL